MKTTGRITGLMEPINYKFVSLPFKNRVISVQYYAEKFLRFVPRSIPNYPSHGVDHSKNIIELLDDFLENWSIGLTEKEVYLLYLTAWLHDIGIIINRDDHNKHSADIINKSEYLSTQLGREIQTLVGWVVKAHSNKFEIGSVPEEICEVRLRFISSIFRLLDACEIVYDKCPTEVYECIKNELSEENMGYWQGHMSIIGITYKKPSILFYVTDIDKSMFLISHLKDEIESIKDIFMQNNTDIPLVKVLDACL